MGMIKEIIIFLIVFIAGSLIVNVILNLDFNKIKNEYFNPLENKEINKSLEEINITNSNIEEIKSPFLCGEVKTLANLNGLSIKEQSKISCIKLCEYNNLKYDNYFCSNEHFYCSCIK